MMKNIFSITSSLICLLIPFDQTRAQKGEDRMIAFAKQINVSQLDKRLPPQRFDEWFRDLVGRKAVVKWELNDCGEQTGSAADRKRDIPTCAQAEAELADGRKVVVMIAIGTVKKGLSGKPVIFDAFIRQGDQYSTVKQLAELKKEIKGGGN